MEEVGIVESVGRDTHGFEVQNLMLVYDVDLQNLTILQLVNSIRCYLEIQ